MCNRRYKNETLSRHEKQVKQIVSYMQLQIAMTIIQLHQVIILSTSIFWHCAIYLLFTLSLCNILAGLCKSCLTLYCLWTIKVNAWNDERSISFEFEAKIFLNMLSSSLVVCLFLQSLFICHPMIFGQNATDVFWTIPNGEIIKHVNIW